jgi:hypothetical protein
MRSAHTLTTNKFLIPKAILDADLVINVPKVKVHQKAGITGALKNLVGLNGHKDYLPHFRFGCPATGGDEYPDGNAVWDFRWYCMHQGWDAESGWQNRLWSLLGDVVQVASYKLGLVKKVDYALGNGSWYANDTLWRTVLDINRAFFYYNRTTKHVAGSPDKTCNYLVISDGLVGGEGEGPLAPSPIRSGFMLAGRNPVAVDAVQASLMGFDISSIPQIWGVRGFETYALASFLPEQTEVCGAITGRRIAQLRREAWFPRFQPAAGWVGRIEPENTRSRLTPVAEIGALSHSSQV